jgi:multidrug efflux pump
VATITVTFLAGTDPDTAQVQVQNKIQQATPQLPTEVQAQGLSATILAIFFVPLFFILVRGFSKKQKATEA